jgi:hypothetical protein
MRKFRRFIALLFILNVSWFSKIQATVLLTSWQSSDTPSYSSSSGYSSIKQFTSSTNRYAYTFNLPNNNYEFTGIKIHVLGLSGGRLNIDLFEWNSLVRGTLGRFNESQEWVATLNHGDTISPQFQTFEFNNFNYRLSPSNTYALVFQSFDPSKISGLAINQIFGQSFGGLAFTTNPASSNYNGVSGGGSPLIQLSFIPEPSSLSLLVFGGLALVLNKRRRA